MFDLSALSPELYRQIKKLQRDHPRIAAKMFQNLERKSILLEAGDMSALTALVMDERKSLMAELDQIEIDQLAKTLNT